MDPNLEGMTVNERLLVSGLFAEFDRAARTRDRMALIDVLTRAQLAPAQAEETTDALLADPKRYGF